MLLRLAMSSSAELTWSSEIAMPSRSACSSSIRCRIRRSSTCLRSTLSGGSAMFCACSRLVTSFIWASTSLSITTPSLTTAAIRSSNVPWVDRSRVCAMRLALEGQRAEKQHHHGSGANGEKPPHALVHPHGMASSSGASNDREFDVRRSVPGNGLHQRGIRSRSDTGQAREFQLQPDPGVLRCPFGPCWSGVGRQRSGGRRGGCSSSRPCTGSLQSSPAPRGPPGSTPPGRRRPRTWRRARRRRAPPAIRCSLALWACRRGAS